jgi:hypothetical protein
MLAGYFLPWIHESPIGAFVSFFYPVLTNSVLLLVFYKLAGMRLKSTDVIILVLLGLWIADWIGFGLAILTHRVEVLSLYFATGDGRFLSDVSVVSIQIAGTYITGRHLDNMLLAIASIPGGILLGYISTFAFHEINRTIKVASIIYWVALNFMATLVLMEMSLCGFAPYLC